MVLGRKDNQDIQTNGIEDCQGNITEDERHVLNIWENCIKEKKD
jgi:hypothetical protein